MEDEHLDEVQAVVTAEPNALGNGGIRRIEAMPNCLVIGENAPSHSTASADKSDAMRIS